jgi:Beta-lactamase enzyme family
VLVAEFITQLRSRSECPPSHAVSFQTATGSECATSGRAGDVLAGPAYTFPSGGPYPAACLPPFAGQISEGDVDVPMGELLRMAVSLSDNAAADILLRIVGGPEVVSGYITSLGIAGFRLQDSEHTLHRDVAAQYRNWFAPAGSSAPSPDQ